MFGDDIPGPIGFLFKCVAIAACLAGFIILPKVWIEKIHKGERCLGDVVAWLATPIVGGVILKSLFGG